MAVIFSGKIQGQTSAAAAIATKDIALHDDGLLRYSDANGYVRYVEVAGDVAQLLKEVFTGAGGITHVINP